MHYVQRQPLTECDRQRLLICGPSRGELLRLMTVEERMMVEAVGGVRRQGRRYREGREALEREMKVEAVADVPAGVRVGRSVRLRSELTPDRSHL